MEISINFNNAYFYNNGINHEILGFSYQFLDQEFKC